MFRQALKDLHSHETQLRLEQVDKALQETFEWIFSDESLAFEAWLKSDDPLYWIRGKPGSGKSTLMKMALQDSRTAAALQRDDRKCSTASFFFHDRGSEIQKSFKGLLQAVLSTMLGDIPELREPVYEAYRRDIGRIGDKQFLWTADVLIDAFNSILHDHRVSASLCIFLDALDEYAGDHAHIAGFLQGLTKQPESSVIVKVCFSSRLESVFVDNLSHLPGFHIHDKTLGDITRLVDARFAANGGMRRCLAGLDEGKEAAERLRTRILSLAEGVFLWVKLILDELLQEFTDGSDLEDLHGALDRIPTDLQDFYKYIVNTRINPKHTAESNIIFELVRCAVQPLTLRQLLIAFQLASLPDGASFPDNIPLKTVDRASRFVGSRSGGLIEIKRREGEPLQLSEHDVVDSGLDSHNVQFLHQTVKTFAATRTPSANLSASCAANVNGFHCLLKMDIFFAEKLDFGRFHYESNISIYALLAEDQLQASLVRLFQAHWSPKVLMNFKKEARLFYVNDLMGLAMFLPSPRMVSELVRATHAQNSHQNLRRLWYYLCTGFFSEGEEHFKTYEALLREISMKIESWRALAIIKDLIYHPHDDQSSPKIDKAMAANPDYYPDLENVPKQRHVQWESSDSIKLRFRSHFENVFYLLRHFLDIGVDVNTRIPVRRPGFWDSHHYTLILHVTASHWSTKKLFDVVLRGEGVEINAVDSNGYTALDCALTSYSVSVAQILKRESSEKAALGNKRKLTDRQWYKERFGIATSLIDRGAKVSSLFADLHLLEPADLEKLLDLGLPTNKKLFFPQSLSGESVADTKMEVPVKDKLGVMATLGRARKGVRLNMWFFAGAVIMLVIGVVCALLKYC